MGAMESECRSSGTKGAKQRESLKRNWQQSCCCDSEADEVENEIFLRKWDLQRLRFYYHTETENVWNRNLSLRRYQHARSPGAPSSPPCRNGFYCRSRCLFPMLSWSLDLRSAAMPDSSIAAFGGIPSARQRTCVFSRANRPFLQHNSCMS